MPKRGSLKNATYSNWSRWCDRPQTPSPTLKASSAKSGAIVSSHWGLENTFELLDRLKSSIRTCASRADQLEREFTLHASRLDRQIDQEIRDLEARLANS